jgi:hypothetical protein
MSAVGAKRRGYGEPDGNVGHATIIKNNAQWVNRRKLKASTELSIHGRREQARIHSAFVRHNSTIRWTVDCL